MLLDNQNQGVIYTVVLCCPRKTLKNIGQNELFTILITKLYFFKHEYKKLFRCLFQKTLQYIIMQILSTLFDYNLIISLRNKPSNNKNVEFDFECNFAVDNMEYFANPTILNENLLVYALGSTILVFFKNTRCFQKRIKFHFH